MIPIIPIIPPTQPNVEVTNATPATYNHVEVTNIIDKLSFEGNILLMK